MGRECHVTEPHYRQLIRHADATGSGFSEHTLSNGVGGAHHHKGLIGIARQSL
ncbi:hypothetical protein D3C76_1557340 [compost metagenome]